MLVPAHIIRSMLLLGVALTIAAIWLGSLQPATGVKLVEHNQTVVTMVDGTPAGPVYLVQGGRRILIQPMDIVKDSDVFDQPLSLNLFFRRQTLLAAMSRSPDARLIIGDKSVPVQASRGVLGNPVSFWLILLPGLVGIAVSALVLAADPKNLANRLVALTGLLFPFVTAGAAIAISRDLAIDGELYRWLMLSHELSATAFAVVMVALFCIYPRRLVSAKLLRFAAALSAIWVLAIGVGRFLEWTDTSGKGAAGALVWLRAATGGSQVTVTLLFVALCAAVALQFRAARRDPLARAALTWFGLSVILGAGGFIALLTLPNLLGIKTVTDGAVGFPLLLLIYAGLTFGMLRYRLFEAKAWTFRVLFAVCATAALWVVDAAMIYGLNLDKAPAMGISLILVGLGYQPARAKLAGLLTRRSEIPKNEMFAAAIEVAFAPPAERFARWQILMRHLFEPLEIEPHAKGRGAAAQIAEDGVAMFVADLTGGTTLRIAYPGHGTRLFSPEDRELVDEMATLCRHAADALRSYDRGAADERRRMAQDLHDDIGARLLSGIHVAQGPVKSLLQDALRDIRTLVTGLIGESAPMSRVIADIRHETASRLEAAGIELEWPIMAQQSTGQLMPYQHSKAITSAIREAVSNTIHHAGARRMTVRIRWDGGSGIVEIADDGLGIPMGTPHGTGLNGIASRMAGIGGSLRIEDHAAGTCLTLSWPLGTDSSLPPKDAPYGR